MPTVCDLKVELKNKGIKGISGLNKSGLQKLLSTGKAPPKEPKQEPKQELKKKSPPHLRLEYKEDDSSLQALSTKSYVILKRLVEKIERLANDSNATANESKNANKKLDTYRKAMEIAKKRQYGGKKKKN